MKYLVKDMFLFPQHKGGSKGFRKMTKGLMTLSIKKGSDPSMMILSGKLWRHENDPFLKHIGTWNEKWILYNNTKTSGLTRTRHQSISRNLSSIRKSVWWQYNSFLKPGETITALKYYQQLYVMHRKLRERQTTLVNRIDPVLLHDNARLHLERVIQTKLNNLRIEVLPHSPYSPDLS